MKIHHLTVAECLHSLDSREEGLASPEAARRLHEFGPNQVSHARQESLVRRFLHQFTHFFALVLWAAAALAFVSAWQEPGQGMETLGVAILCVIFVNGVFSFVQEYRAERALASLRRLLPAEVKVLRDSQVGLLPASALVPGDVLLLEEGDQVPADARVLETHGARVNNATITGESVPELREAGPSGEEELVRSPNVVLAGTFLTTGRLRALVFATGMQTEFGRIAHLTQATPAELSPLQREIVRLGHIVAVLAMALGGVFFLIGRALGLPPWENLLFAIGIIVANVPEGLLPTVTLALAMASQRMARRNVVVRDLVSVETLGSATVICTDKTGTLTENRMEARALFVASGRHDASPQALVSLGASYPRLFEGARLCHMLQEVRRDGAPVLAGDPMEVALVHMGARARPGPLEARREDELPFDPERKRLSTVHRMPEGRLLHTKGALESVLSLCREVETEQGVRPLTPELAGRFRDEGEVLAREGLRVLAFAYRRLPDGVSPSHWEEGLVLSGLVGLEDPFRPEVPAAIQRCREAGIRVILVTGDHPRTAEAVARQVGLVRTERPVVLTSAELRRLSDTQLQLALDAPEVLFARVAPVDKRRVVMALKRKREVVAVTGDGVNDAPALKEAHIGIAMGLAGTDVAREAADVVLADDNFASIVAAVEEGRAVYSNIRKFLTYILTSNVPEIVPYLAFVLLRIPLPLSILQILAVDLGTDMLPALALGAEPPHARVMHQPPSDFRRRLLDAPLLLRAYLFLGVMEAAAGMAAFFFVLGRGGWSYGEPLAWNAPLHLRAMAACLGAIVVMQVMNVLLCRTERAPTFSVRLRDNPLLFVGVAVELLLLGFIVYTPWGNRVFATAPLPGSLWLFVLPFAVGMLALEEARKAWTRRVRWRRGGRGGLPRRAVKSPVRAHA
ncbi:cation-translocating P-type ATPase [Corallococcus coralloides]|uniref:cation-translocating P-type ATPase n=1 Tax=Corallococcus coralloides TaxID=184914 RepID=UPI00384F4B01